ncbi:hypothetical protein UlMin_011983 [Ulmus minor]
MGRSPCCAKEGLNRGAWTAMEDEILTEYVRVHGEGKWRNLPKRAGLKRCGKSCRLRWLNYLRPDIKRGNISHDEEELIIRLHNLLGNKWSLIAGRLPGRTDNEIKNYWNTNIGKKIGKAEPFSSTTSRITPNRDKNEEPNLKPSKAIKPTSATTSPNVVRTKASRCTKVIIPQNLHRQIGQTRDHHVQSPTQKVMDQTYGVQPSLPLVDPNQSYSNDHLTMEFEKDENFLSDFLNNDCLELSNYFGEGLDDHNTIASNTSNWSPKSDHQTFLFSEELLFGDKDYLINPNEMEWLLD